MSIAITKTHVDDNCGAMSIIDTHSVPVDFGGNGKGIKLGMEYSCKAKDAVSGVIANWLARRLMKCGVPQRARQVLYGLDDIRDCAIYFECENDFTEAEKLSMLLNESDDVAEEKTVLETIENPNGRQKEEILWRGYATQLGITNFWLLQIKAIGAFSDGKDSCFQVPAIMSKGKFVLVISQTISLMQSQVSSLQDRGINALFIGPVETGEKSCSSYWYIMEP